MQRAARTMIVLGAASLVGCGAVLGFDQISYTAPGGSDDATTANPDAEADAPSDDEASTLDASSNDVVALDAGDAATDDAACTNLILNAGFEGTTGCEPWMNFGGSYGLGSPANSGSYACRACAEVGAVNALGVLSGLTFPPGETVHFEVWARAEDSLLYGHTMKVAALGGNGESTDKDFVLSDVYQRMSVDHVLTPTGGDAQAPRAQILVGVNAPDSGACILFDDVRLCVTHDGG